MNNLAATISGGLVGTWHGKGASQTGRKNRRILADHAGSTLLAISLYRMQEKSRMRETEAQIAILVKTVSSCAHAGYTPRGGHTVPASYHIDKARRLVISTASGLLTADDLSLHQRQLLGDPDFDPSCSQIFDCTAVSGIDFDAEDIGAL